MPSAISSMRVPDTEFVVPILASLPLHASASCPERQVDSTRNELPGVSRETRLRIEPPVLVRVAGAVEPELPDLGRPFLGGGVDRLCLVELLEAALEVADAVAFDGLHPEGVRRALVGGGVAQQSVDG